MLVPVSVFLLLLMLVIIVILTCKVFSGGELQGKMDANIKELQKEMKALRLELSQLRGSNTDVRRSERLRSIPDYNPQPLRHVYNDGKESMRSSISKSSTPQQKTEHVKTSYAHHVKDRGCDNNNACDWGSDSHGSDDS